MTLDRGSVLPLTLDPQRPASAGGLPAAQRQSTRRKPHVDLSRLDVQSLRKYRRTFKLGEPQTLSGGSKEEVLPAALRHWQTLVRPLSGMLLLPAGAEPRRQVVEEDETVLSFAVALRKASQAAKKLAGPGKFK